MPPKAVLAHDDRVRLAITVEAHAVLKRAAEAQNRTLIEVLRDLILTHVEIPASGAEPRGHGMARRRILALVRSVPGVPIAHVAPVLGISQSNARKIVCRLKRQGLVQVTAPLEEWRKNRTQRVYPAGFPVPVYVPLPLRILRVVQAHPEGLPLRALHERAGASLPGVKSALRPLQQAGQVDVRMLPCRGIPGRQALAHVFPVAGAAMVERNDSAQDAADRRLELKRCRFRRLPPHQSTQSYEDWRAAGGKPTRLRAPWEARALGVSP